MEEWPKDEGLGVVLERTTESLEEDTKGEETAGDTEEAAEDEETLGLVDGVDGDKIVLDEHVEELTDSQLDLGSFGQEDATWANFWFLIA